VLSFTQIGAFSRHNFKDHTLFFCLRIASVLSFSQLGALNRHTFPRVGRIACNTKFFLVLNVSLLSFFLISNFVFNKTTLILIKQLCFLKPPFYFFCEQHILCFT
jgi:hypothetical protein